jgi:nitrite reductase (NADH) small subunit
MVALFHVQERIYALDGVCPHQGGPLGQGELAGCLITCPWHGWQFDVRTGKHRVNPSMVQPCFPVKVEDNAIWIEMEY